MTTVLDEHPQLLTVGGNPIVGGKVYYGESGTDPETNPISIYSDRDLTVEITNPQIINENGRTENKVYLSGRYSIKVTDSNDVQLYQNLDNGTAGGDATASITEISDDYDVSVLDEKVLFLVDANSGDITLTLPSAALAGNGFEISVKKTDDTDNNVIIEGNGAETVEGSDRLPFGVQNRTITLRCSFDVVPDDWKIVSDYVDVPGKVLTISENYTVEIADEKAVLLVDASSGIVTINLLSSVISGKGFEIDIKKIDSSNNAVIIDGYLAETIAGRATLSLLVQYEHVTIRCSGGVGSDAWNVISSQIVRTNVISIDDTDSPYTVSVASIDSLIECDDSSGSIVVNLPAAADVRNRSVKIKKSSSAINNVTIDADNSETIDGSLTYVITQENGSIRLLSDGSKWYVESGHVTSATEDYEGLNEIATQVEVDNGTDPKRVLTPATFTNAAILRGRVWLETIQAPGVSFVDIDISDTTYDHYEIILSNVRGNAGTDIECILIDDSSSAKTVYFASHRNSASGMTIYQGSDNNPLIGNNVDNLGQESFNGIIRVNYPHQTSFHTSYILQGIYRTAFGGSFVTRVDFGATCIDKDEIHKLRINLTSGTFHSEVRFVVYGIIGGSPV